MIDVFVDGNKISVYEMNNLFLLANKLQNEIKWKKTYKYLDNGKRYQVEIADYPISFDIETSSFYNTLDGEYISNSDVEKILDDAYDKEYKAQYKKSHDEQYARTKALLKKAQVKDDYQQRACMYIWQMAFGNNDTVIIGRTWGEFLSLLDYLKCVFDLSDTRKIIIYDFNYHYEWGFIKNYFTWDNEKYGCLMTDRVTYYTNTAGIYKPDPEMPSGISIQSFKGFLFKDACVLAGTKEENLPKIMKNAKTRKLTGSLNYELTRHSKTELTNDELAYCIYDVILLNEYIQEKIDEYGSIVDIPMTKTEETRRRIRDKVLYTNPNIKSKKDYKFIKYRKFLDDMKIDFKQYQMIRRAYAGGFTHANYGRARQVWEDCVMSADIASSYPAVMVCKKYCMSPYKRVQVQDKSQFWMYIDKYSCLFDVVFYNIRPRHDDVDFDLVDNIISISKCHSNEYKDENGILHNAPIFECEEDSPFVNNNGRLRHAKKIVLTINEVDFDNICLFYDFDDFDIDNFYIAKKDYLPKDLILAVLDLFDIKTKYKPFDGTDTPEGLAYALSKVDINGIYGMASTDPLKMSYELDNSDGYYVLKSLEQKYQDDPDAYNNLLSEMLSNKLDSKNQFLCYQWSHLMTSYARQNLFRAIEASGINHVYSDTDSEKFIKNQKTLDFIKEYNKEIDELMNACFEYHGIDKDRHKSYYIKDGKKIEKCLGYFEIENKGECYKKFVTTGAKRYLTQTSDGELHLTVAGLNKKSIDYMQEKYGDKLFDEFANGNIKIDREHTGKLIATYIDFSTKGEVVDYKGEHARFCELSSVHLEKNEFDMHLTDTYEKLTSDGRIMEGL